MHDIESLFSVFLSRQRGNARSLSKLRFRCSTIGIMGIVAWVRCLLLLLLWESLVVAVELFASGDGVH
jgi:hypothetical protein